MDVEALRALYGGLAEAGIPNNDVDVVAEVVAPALKVLLKMSRPRWLS